MIEILIRYLGIKTKLLDVITEEIVARTDEQDTVLDLFAGSNIVSMSLSKTRRVITNDIQEYSYIVSGALLGDISSSILDSISVSKITDNMYYEDNYQFLLETFRDPYIYEEKIINKCYQVLQDSGDFEADCFYELKYLYEDGPYPGKFNDDLKRYAKLRRYYDIEYYRSLHNKEKDTYYQLFTLLYALPYFSLKQAFQIDSLRYSIEKLYENNQISIEEYNIYLSALIYSLQKTVTSVGDHFAQPQQFKLIDEKKYHKEITKIISKKRETILDHVKYKLFEFKNSEERNSNNMRLNKDFMEVLSDETIMREVAAIYVDPPYTNAHYSRFYHILETLVKYDYPLFEFKGRYRSNRHQSPFSIKSEALNSFEDMVRICSENRKKMFISYSDTSQSLIPYNEFIDVCKKYYSDVEIHKIEHLYRNFGQKPNRVIGNELLVMCE